MKVLNDIKVVTVIGAGGTMGCNISAIFASFGSAKVYMVDRNKPLEGVERAIKSVKSESIRNNLIPTDISNLEKCVSESDLVFESVVEDINVKKMIAINCAKLLKKGSVLCTGTSGLSITEIANSLPEDVRSRYYGVHFFNPPYTMVLCELITTRFASKNVVRLLKSYLEDTLYRTVVLCKDKPAFLANRIGFEFINKSLQLAEKYCELGGIDYIDSIFGGFTGRLIAPCATADFVGLDVHKAIVNNIFENTNDLDRSAFALPHFIEDLINSSKLGRKTREGLYKIEIDECGNKNELVYDIKTQMYRKKRQYVFEFATKMKDYLSNGDYELAFDCLLQDQTKEAFICKQLLKEYIDYSLYVGEEICDDLSYIDDAMATGFGWCPPLALSNVLFKTNYLTKYDYRKFFKGGK